MNENEDATNLEKLRELQDKLYTVEDELLRRDALLAAIVQNARDAIIARDLNGRVIAWNNGATELYGWTADEMIGGPIYKIVPPDKIDEHEEWIRAAQEGRGVGPIFSERITKDGRRIKIWISVSPIIARNGEILGASAIEHGSNGHDDH